MIIRCLSCMEQYDDSYVMCPCCGCSNEDKAESAIHIDPGTLLHNRYIIGRVIGSGGFGVTYIGWDGKLEIKVAIKEYFPSEFSTRMPGQSYVTVFEGKKREQFNDGMNKFIDEAKRLANFQGEKGIVNVYDNFTENDTAYIIMEYLDGETLSARLEREGTIPEKQAVDMLMPVMRSLINIHSENIIHRDIAPDNIFITKDGAVKLIDFGASRYATTSHSRSLTVVIKQGYSPEEQYRSKGDQGPHTDVYSLASTLYKMITGVTPPDAMERRSNKEGKNKEILVEPHIANKSANISRITENAILNAMNVRIEDRTPDIKTFMGELTAEKPAKRKAGKIARIDVYRWPLWLRITLPVIMCVTLVFVVLIGTNVIDLRAPTEGEISVPDGYMVVPDVENMKVDKAIDMIEGGGLTAIIVGNVESEYVEAGKIVYQSPNGKTYLPVNGSVELTISSGSGVIAPSSDNDSTVMPYIIGSTEEEAKAALSKAGLGTPIIEYENSSSVKAGCVISTSPEYNTKLSLGAVVTIVISNGTNGMEMPDVVGKDQEDAVKILNDMGLIAEIAEAYKEGVTEGTVIKQDVKAGTSVSPGQKVKITVCRKASNTDSKSHPSTSSQSSSSSSAPANKPHHEGEIYTVEDLKNIRSDFTGTYTLMNDITIRGDWTPIDTFPVGGTFNGNGHSISFNIYNLNKISFALFEDLRNAYIFNLTFNGRVTFNIIDHGLEAGSLARNAEGCEITNCTNNVDFDINYSYAPPYGVSISIGGLVNYIVNSTIINCSNNGEIMIYEDTPDVPQYSSIDLGGIVADARGEYCSINNCYNYADLSIIFKKGISNNSFVFCGGIVGSSTGFERTLYNCDNFAVVRITAEDTILANSDLQIYQGMLVGHL